MPREFQRAQRLGEQIHRVLSELIRREIDDPRVAWVTLTGVEVSRDLSHAKVYFSVLGDDAAGLEDTTRALRGASGFLRSRLGREIVVRNLPELRFVHDESSRRAERLQNLLDEAEDPHRAAPSPEEP